MVDAKVAQQYELKNLPAQVTLSECNVPINRSDFLSTDIYNTVTEADRVRLSYNILNDQKFTEMKNS